MSVLFPYAFLSGAPGPFEWLVLFFVILLLFGPRRLPEIARTLGRVLEELRRASSEFRDQVMQIEDSETVDISDEVAEEPGTKEQDDADTASH